MRINWYCFPSAAAMTTVSASDANRQFSSPAGMGVKAKPPSGEGALPPFGSGCSAPLLLQTQPLADLASVKKQIRPLLPRRNAPLVHENVAPARSTLGVVRFTGRATPMPDGMIERLQRREDPGAGCVRAEALDDRARVEAGASADLDGISQTRIALHELFAHAILR